MSNRLEKTKRLFLRQLDLIEHNVPSFTTVKKQTIEWLRFKTQTIQTIDELGALLMFPIPNRDMGMRLLDTQPNVHPIENTCFLFGSGSIGWYTLRCQSLSGNTGFVFFLSRIEVACPYVVRDSATLKLTTDSAMLKLAADSAAIYYCTVLIYKDYCRPHVVQGRFLFGEYESQGTNLFHFKAYEQDVHNFMSMELESRRTGEIHLVYQDEQRTIVATVKQNTMPFYDGPHEGTPMMGKTGLLRWSMSNMHAQFSINDQNHNGLGWLSHEWKRSDPSPKGLIRFWSQIHKRMFQPSNAWMSIRLYIQFHNVQSVQYVVQMRLNPTDKSMLNLIVSCSLYKFNALTIACL